MLPETESLQTLAPKGLHQTPGLMACSGGTSEAVWCAVAGGVELEVGGGGSG